MIVTVLWEDQRGGPEKGFGPHELLVSCVADELSCDRWVVDKRKAIRSVPLKGRDNVVAFLKTKLSLLSNDAVCVVLDRDKVLDIWSGKEGPSDCIASIKQALIEEAPGKYELVLLVDNVESLVKAGCEAAGLSLPPTKPNPTGRDQLLRPAVHGQRKVRDRVREDVPSFNRIVKWVCGIVGPTGNSVA